MLSEELSLVIKRLSSGSPEEADIITLVQAIQKKEISFATGERAVVLGAGATDAVVITGNQNIVSIYKGEQAEEINRAIQGRTAPEGVQDTVYSTFFPVLQMPQHIYAAPSKFSGQQEKEAKQAILYPALRGTEIYPFIIRAGMLFCFQDLSFSNSPFRDLISGGKLERYDASDWWNDAERINWYLTLLNRSLNKLTGHRGLSLDKEHHRYFFTPESDGKPKRVTYRPLNQSTSERSVAWQPITKKSGQPKPYWLHRAVSLKFHRVAKEQWCFSIRPEMRVTRDGYQSLNSAQVGRHITPQKSRMHNYELLGEVNFWRDYLSGSSSQISMRFSKLQAVIISTSMMQSEVNWPGIPEEYSKPFKNVDYDADPFDEEGMIEFPNSDNYSNESEDNFSNNCEDIDLENLPPF